MDQRSYTQGNQDKPLLALTIGEAFDLTATRFSALEALVVTDQSIRWTWAELKSHVDHHARALIGVGVTPGSRIGIWAPNCWQWCVTQFAAAKIGAILVNINPAYRSSELEYVLSQSGCSWLISAHAFKNSDYHEIIRQAIPEISNTLPGNLKLERLSSLRGIVTLADHAPSGLMTWDELQTYAEQVSQRELDSISAALQFDDPINIQYTSGTTGFPKGATLSHYNILNNGYMVGESLGLTEIDRVVVPVPLYHCFGMVMGNLGCITHGSTIIYPGAAFDPLTVLQTISKEKATVLYGVPTMFIAELEHPGRAELDLSTLRTGIMAGATCPVDVMHRVMTEMHMEEVQIAYGMTETSPVSLQTGPRDSVTQRVATVGKTQPHLESKIVDSQGEIVDRGVVGELCTRGYSVMLGYWKDPTATSETIDASRWIHTGDLASMDEDGYVSIVGRSKDMIIRGGENIYPRELEEFYIVHPAISDVYVIGIPDDKYGEELVAWVRVQPGAAVTDEELRLWSKDRIAHFKVPRTFKFVDTFPMTVTGKIQKFLMREISLKERNQPQ